MMNIAVIYPRPNEKKDARFGFSYDWALLGTALHNAGHLVLLRDYSVEQFDRNTFVSDLDNRGTQIAMIEFDSFTLKRSENNIHGAELIRIIKRRTKKYQDHCLWSLPLHHKF